MLLIVTVTNFCLSKSTNRNGQEFVNVDILFPNILHVPEIIRNYEIVKLVYGKKNTLFFRYVSNYCSSCLDNQLNEILSFQEEIGKEHVWIFPAYPNDRNSRIQLSNELAKFNYRNIPADSLLIPVYDGEQKSYFAWINNEGELDMVFIPDRNNVHYTRQYFLEVKKRLQRVE